MRDEYLKALKDALDAYSIENKEEILEKYTKRYDFGLESEMEESVIEQMLGNPLDIARGYVKDNPIILENKADNEIKYDALRFLSYAYKEKGELDSARKALEQIPEIYFSKLSELAFLLSGEEKYEVANKEKWISFEILIQMMWKIAESYEEQKDTDSAIKETKAALELIKILDNRSFDPYVNYFNKQIERMSKK